MFCKLLYKKLCIINHETDAWCAKNEILNGSVWNICIQCVSCKSVFRTYHYDQGRPSSQCHRAMALVVFCPAPNFRAYIECPVTKSLETPNWHWLILFSMGALEYHSIISTVGPRTVFRVCIFFLILGRLNFHYLFDLQWELGLALGISIVFCYHVHSCAEENWQI